MNRKRFIITMAAVFVVATIYDYLIHFIAFSEMYHQTEKLWRAKADMETFPLYVSQLLFAIFFVYIFIKHYDHKGFKSGVRYGTNIGLLFAAVDLATYTYMPIPFILTVSWMGAVFIKCLLCGLTTAVVYNDKS